MFYLGLITKKKHIRTHTERQPVTIQGKNSEPVNSGAVLLGQYITKLIIPFYNQEKILDVDAGHVVVRKP